MAGTRQEPTRRQLGLFAEVVSGHHDGDFALRDVAKELGLTVNGLRGQLEDFAERVGFPVIEPARTARGRWRVTDEARGALSAVQAYLGAAATLSGTLRHRRRGAIRLTCLAGHLYRLGPNLGRCLEQHIDLDLRIDEGYRSPGGPDAFDDLRAYRTDLVVEPSDAIRPTGVEIVGGGALYVWQLVAYPALAKAPSGSIQVDELLGKRLLVSPRGHVSRQLLDEEARKAHVNLEYGVETASTAARWFLAEAGYGIVVALDDALYLRDGSTPVSAIGTSDGSSISGSYSLFCREGDARLPEYERLAVVLKGLPSGR